MIEVHVIVLGTVQGVGFRYAMRQLALKLNLNGSVRNCEDGTVEIIAQGSQQQVDALIKELKDDTGPGHVEDVIVLYRTPKASATSFRIL